MRWRSSQAHDESARARFAGVISFVATLTLIAILLLAKSAQARPLAPLSSGGPLGTPVGLPVAAVTEEEEEEEEEEAEEELGEGGESESEEAETEVEEKEEEEQEEAEARASGKPPYECVLRTARGTVVVQEGQSKLRLQLAYTTFEPAPAAIEYRLRGSRGSLRFSAGRRHLSESGVVRDTETLSRAELAKVVAGRAFTVRVLVPGAPGYCSRYSSRQLTTRRVAAARVSWLQSGSVFGS
jgi:hypothetical protein